MKHLISIIVTFNCENHIYGVCSVRSQNLSEIVKHIVVDESTDKTLEIVRDFKDVDLISEQI